MVIDSGYQSVYINAGASVMDEMLNFLCVCVLVHFFTDEKHV